MELQIQISESYAEKYEKQPFIGISMWHFEWCTTTKQNICQTWVSKFDNSMHTKSRINA